jgi:hypothetical protein
MFKVIKSLCCMANTTTMMYYNVFYGSGEKFHSIWHISCNIKITQN